jgi:SAM-dependent methyltransferase
MRADDVLGGLRSGWESVDHCPACLSASARPYLRTRDYICLLPGQFSLWLCGDCSAVYLDPRPEPAYLADYYPQEEYYAYSPVPPHDLWAQQSLVARVWYAAARGLLADRYGYANLRGSSMLSRLVGAVPPLRQRATHDLGVLLHPWRPGGALLDVGCGSGRYLDLMRSLGWSRVVGVDISERAVANARSLGVEAYAGDLAEIGFPESSFDAVSLSHTLEHVYDPAKLLAEVRRVTAPGGRVAIVVPNARSLSAQILGTYWLGWEAPRHLTNFSPPAIEAVLARAGLTIERMRTPWLGTYQVALFSLSRALGDPHNAYSDPDHRFGLGRRLLAASFLLATVALGQLGWQMGDRIDVVARA